MLLDLLGVKRVAGSMLGVLIHVSAEDRLRVVWLYMFSRALFAVATRTDFIVERTVDFVCFCSVDRRKG